MARSTPYAVNTTADKVLRALGRYQYLTLNQATLASGFSPRSRTWVSTALKELTDNHYTGMHRLSNRSGYGGAPGYWILARRGIRYLDLAGVIHRPRIRNGFDPDAEDYRLRHILAVNDVLIACERFAAETEGVELQSLTHDLYLAREPITVELGEGRQTRLTADGRVRLTAFGYSYDIWVEVDRGTEPIGRWKAKVEAILRYAETLTEPLTVMVVTTAGPKRFTDLWRWTGEQLQAMHREPWADLFRFTACPATERVPDAWLTAPTWVRPGDAQGYPLIEGGRP